MHSHAAAELSPDAHRLAHLNFVHNFLYARHRLCQFLRLFALRRRLYAAFQYQRAVLRIIGNVLLVKVLGCLQLALKLSSMALSRLESTALAWLSCPTGRTPSSFEIA